MEKRIYAGGSAESKSNVRFGAFELDLRRGELRKQWRRIRLQEQPFQILQMLLESPGEVVSREEIRKRLWPDQTVVEFDLSINAAVKRLRDALRESAGNPRYIKTLARQGYRFIGEVEAADHPAEAEPIAVIGENEVTSRPVEEARRRAGVGLSLKIVTAVLLATVVVLVVSVGVWYYRRGVRPSLTALQPLMRVDVALGNEVSPRVERGANAILSPDGTRLVYASGTAVAPISQSKLFTRRLDQPNDTELPGTDGAVGPFFSPDGQWLDSYLKDLRQDDSNI